MNCDNNENMQPKNNKSESTDIEKIELNLPGIFEGFKKVLQEYGVSEIAVVEFRLDESAKLEEALAIETEVSSVLAIRSSTSGLCRCNCGPLPCFRICPCP